MTKLLIAGSREWTDREAMTEAILQAEEDLAAQGRWITTIVVGDCPTGADDMAAEFAIMQGFELQRHEADWDRYGKAAGPIRNAQMVNAGAEMCLAFYKKGAGNRGTNNCASLAEAAGIPVRRFYK